MSHTYPAIYSATDNEGARVTNTVMARGETHEGAFFELEQVLKEVYGMRNVTITLRN